MNNARRKEISKIRDDLASLYSDIETLMDEEQEYLDNMPENLQGSEKYETAEDAVCGVLAVYLRGYGDARKVSFPLG